MKTHIVTIITIFIAAITFAQAPNNLSYQAIIRKNDGSLVLSSKVGFQFSIFQGTENGVLVYKETQNISSNKDGLVSLKIGSGVASVGTFSSIDWSGGLFFIKVEIDVNGGSNYLLSSVSQFSTVPFAFFVSDAGKVDYKNVKNIVPLDSIQSNIDSLKKLNVSYEKKIDSLIIENKPHFIGENYGGGIVFFTYDNGKHGLISSKQDQKVVSTHAFPWGSPVIGNVFAHAIANGYGAGDRNTTLITLQNRTLVAVNFAALMCEILNVTDADGMIYSDWYLPSKYELDLLFKQRFVIGNFTTDPFNETSIYWTSTEVSISVAFAQSFEDGASTSELKTTFYKVRAIRKF